MTSTEVHKRTIVAELHFEGGAIGPFPTYQRTHDSIQSALDEAKRVHSLMADDQRIYGSADGANATIESDGKQYGVSTPDYELVSLGSGEVRRDAN